MQSSPFQRKNAALSLVFVGAVLFPAPALAETVYLRDGRMIKGDVTIRPDGKVEISRPGKGALVLDKGDVLRVDPDTGAPQAARAKKDTVLTTDGRSVSGTVTLSDDGKEIIVRTEKGEGETRIARELVKSIQWRNGTVQAGPSGQSTVSDDDSDKKWRAQVDVAIEALRAPNLNEKDLKKARKEIIELGIYARAYIEKKIADIALVGSQDTVVLPILKDVLRVADLKRVVTTQMEEHNVDVCERLIDQDSERRKSAVLQAVVNDPEDAPALLLHMIHKDPDPVIKGMCVSQLAMLKRWEDLGTVLKMEENRQLRFTAALYLGDAGIYAGIPVLIEALELDQPKNKDIRTTAIEKLKEYTGLGNLGYLPDEDDKAKRAEAVARWSKWWDGEGALFLRKNERMLSRSEISPEDQKLALDSWHQGNKKLEDLAKKEKDAQESGKPLDPKDVRETYETAEYLFEKALEKDPSLVSARLSRAILLYQQLKRAKEAETELKSVLHRFAAEAKYPKVLANHHLARIYEQRADWRQALVYYLSAVRLDDGFVEGYMGQGDCYLELALAWTPGPPAAGGAGGGNSETAPREGHKEPPPESPEGTQKDVEKPIVGDGGGKPNGPDPRLARDDLLKKAMGAYRIALEVIQKKNEGLLQSAELGQTQSGLVENLAGGALMVSIRGSKENLAAIAASVYFRMGRVDLARMTSADPEHKTLKDAVSNFDAARRLQPDDERYKKAAEFWEEQLKRESEAGK